MLAVLPFDNLSGNPEQEYFSDGLTEEMIARVAQVNPTGLGVIARTSIMLYKRADRNVTQIGQELGLEYVLEGSVRRDGDRVRIAVQLIQVRDQTHLWANTFDREATGLLAIQEEIAEQVAQALQRRLLPVRRTTQPRQLNPSPAAHEAYLQGRHYWNKRTPEDVQKGNLYFEEAIRLAPNYARAYAGLADCYNLLASYGVLTPKQAIPRAKAAAARALELEPTLAEAHASLGFARFGYDWDWSGAEQSFLRTLDLDPNYATAHQWYALYLSAMGRADEAIAATQQALHLDPLAPIIAMGLGSRYFHARRYDEAIAQFQRALDLDPGFALAYHNLGRALLMKKQFDEAIQALETAAQLSHHQPARKAALAYAYARAGRRGDAAAVLAALQRESARTPVPAFPMALLALSLGETDQALAFLERVYEERHSDITLLKVEPMLDPLRDDARFQDLMHRVGFLP